MNMTVNVKLLLSLFCPWEKAALTGSSSTPEQETFITQSTYSAEQAPHSSKEGGEDEAPPTASLELL